MLSYKYALRFTSHILIRVIVITIETPAHTVENVCTCVRHENTKEEDKGSRYS